MAARIAIMAITTSNSISVNPGRERVPALMDGLLSDRWQRRGVRDAVLYGSENSSRVPYLVRAPADGFVTSDGSLYRFGAFITSSRFVSMLRKARQTRRAE